MEEQNSTVSGKRINPKDSTLYQKFLSKRLGNGSHRLALKSSQSKEIPSTRIDNMSKTMIA